MNNSKRKIWLRLEPWYVYVYDVWANNFQMDFWVEAKRCVYVSHFESEKEESNKFPLFGIILIWKAVKQVKWWHLWCFWWNAMNDMRFTIKVYIVYVLYMYMRCLSRLMNVQFGCGNENACKYFIVIVLVVSQWFATKEVISKYLSFSMQNSLVSPFFSFVLWKDSFSWRECKRKRLFK